LHLLRHLFRGNRGLITCNEIALLPRHRTLAMIRSGVRGAKLHPAALRRLEAIAFRLARGNGSAAVLAPVVAEADRRARWPASKCGSSTNARRPRRRGEFHPNKPRDVVGNSELVGFSAVDRARLFVRRLAFRPRCPSPAGNVYVREEQLTWAGCRLQGAVKYAGHITDSHQVPHPSCAASHRGTGVIWKSRATPACRPRSWRFGLGCSLLYFLGMYQFALLYKPLICWISGYSARMVLGLSREARFTRRMFSQACCPLRPPARIRVGLKRHVAGWNRW